MPDTTRCRAPTSRTDYGDFELDVPQNLLMEGKILANNKDGIFVHLRLAPHAGFAINQDRLAETANSKAIFGVLAGQSH